MKRGDILSNVEFLRVDEVHPNDHIDVTNITNGVKFSVKGKELIDTLSSADEFTTTKKVSKTELAEKLLTCYNVAFKVCFDKQDGTERVMRAKLVSHESLMGRSMCHDFDVTSGHPLRQVDHRTIKWLIVGGVKYVLKGTK